MPGDHGPGPALGRFGKLHGLRKMRAGVPHGGAIGEGEVGCGDVQTPAVSAVSDVDARRAARRAAGAPMSPLKSKIRLATVRLDGCSGRHMSLLDTDERLIALAQQVDVVWGPLVDAKEFPSE